MRHIRIVGLLTLCGALQAAASGAATLGITRVSVASDGTQTNAISSSPSLSADGRFVAFASSASNLVPGDTNGAGDIFVHDRLTGVTTRESVGAGGAQANANSSLPSISADGRYVAFLSFATNLVPGVTLTQVYVRDRQLGLTTIASVSTDGAPGNAGVLGFSLSDDGRFVSFSSSANNLVAGDTNGVADIFTRDLVNGTTTRDSVASDGTQSTGSSSFSPSISRGGRYVAFYSRATNLVSGLTGSIDRIFVRDRTAGQTTVESIGTSGEVLSSSTPSISGDGRFLTFAESTSAAPRLGIYLRDRQTSLTVRVLSTAVGSLLIGADGRYITFAGTISGQTYLQLFDRSTGQFSIISQCDCSGDLTQVGGSVVAFGASTPLVTNDTNRTTDIFVGVVAALPGAPDPPTNLAFSLAGSTLTLTWTAPAGGAAATEYVLEAGTVSRSTDTANFSTGSADTSFSTPFNSRTTFFIRVRAANAAGVSLPSSEIVLALGALPGAPTGLTASATGSNVALTWTAATGPVVSYVIEAGSATGLSDVANFNTGTSATTFSGSGVIAGTYFIRVRAASAGGVGPASNEVMVTVTNTCPPPGPPAGLTRSVTGSSVTLSWSAGSGATSYVLEGGSSAGASDLVLTDLQSPATTFISTGVSAGTYFVRLRSKNACGQSGPSNEVTVIVTAQGR